MWTQLQMYSHLHARELPHQRVPCHVDVINLIEETDEDAFNGANFAQFFTPEYQNPYIRMIHAVFHKDTRQVKLLTASQAEPTVVKIDRDALTGATCILSWRRSGDW